jgi:serine/threonine-protein kinase
MAEVDDVHTTAGRGNPQQHWDRLASLFQGALDRPAGEREAYLRERADDARMLTEIRALLAAYTTSPGPLERVMAAVMPPASAPAAISRTAVGPYELLREIGRGGMGVVYLARRADGEYQRLVALKLARAPVVDAELRGRFLAERDILAGLTHPNIAPLFDAGVTDDGLPYFTMEFVDGVPIDAYCDAHALTVQARIHLFQDICSAVTAAHRALVVHRDLKPNNVLVTASGDVKLVDFGIAKLLAPGRWTDMQDTAADARLMTPAYASPEQVLGRPVSTATDVYALGLLLYELLCGRRAHRLPPGDTPDLHRVVVDTDPMPMAAALSSPGEGDRITADSIARLRQTTAPRLARRLRGDLERIAAMALRKDPDRRYPTAAQLADDLARHLEGRPVTAHGHSLAYRASRFAKRHRITLVAAAITVATLAGYLVLAILHAREMERAAARERIEAQRASDVTDFVVGLFEASDPNVVQNREAPLAQLLEDGLHRADVLAAQPLLQARLLNAIGRVYFSLGRYADAAGVATRALAASRLGAGDQHVDVARDQRLLGLATGALGRQREAVELFRAALEIRRRTSGSRSAEFATDQHHLGYALAQSGEIDEAERHLSDALALRQTLLPAGHEDIAMSLSGMAFVRGRQGRAHDSVALYREALAMRVTGLGPGHPEVARARQNLASALSTSGGFDEAAQELHRALGIYRAVYGDRHPSIATTLNNLGNLEARRRRDGEAVRHFRAALAMRQDLLGPDHPSTVLSQGNLGSVLARTGQLKEAEAMLRAVLARSRGKDDVAMGMPRPQAMANLASVLRDQGRLVESESLAREALDLSRTQRVNPLIQASLLNTLGLTLHAAGRADQAVEMMQQALDLRRRSLGDAHPDVLRTRRDLDRAQRARRSRP